MKRVILFWTYRKEILSLFYLFLIGMAFGAIWIFHDDHKIKKLAFEENHVNLEVTLTDDTLPVSIQKIPPLAHDDLRDLNNVGIPHVSEQNQQVTPLVAIVIDDLGIVRDKTREIINLSAPLTLSFLPYAPKLPAITRLAKSKGHELMLHLPMEPKSRLNPGPHALLTTVSDQEILAELEFNLSRFDGYVGINNHMGSAFTEDRHGLDLVLDEIQARGLLVLDSRTSAKSLLAPMAAGRNIPTETRDIFLDNQQDVKYILAQLAKMEKLAVREGQAIAIGHPYAETIEALSIWLPKARAKGISVVPLSRIIRNNYEKIFLAGKHKQALSVQ